MLRPRLAAMARLPGCRKLSSPLLGVSRRSGAGSRWSNTQAPRLVAGASLFCTTGVAACELRGSAAPEEDPTRLTYVVFGDSITAQGTAAGGWGQRLGEAYIARADVLVRGYPGYNTRFALLGIRRLLRQEGATSAREREMSTHLAGGRLWTVMFGSNDAGLADGGFSVVHVPVEEYEQNLAEIVRTIKGASTAHGGEEASVILLTPPVVDDARLVNDGVASHTTANTGLYAAAARRVAAEHRVALCDVYAEMQQHSKPGEFLSDGLHLSAKGNELVYELVRRTIAEHFPELAATRRPLDLPGVQHLWGDQDYHGVFAKH